MYPRHEIRAIREAIDPFGQLRFSSQDDDRKTVTVLVA